MINAPVLQEMLRDLITKYGPPNDSNSQIYYSELKKSLVNEPREKGLLELSLNYNIPNRLYINQNNPDIIDNLVQELTSQYQVDSHAAEWIVKTWAKSMGIYVAPYRPPDTDKKPQVDSQNTSQIPCNSEKGSFQKPVSDNRAKSSSSYNPPRGNTNQRQYQQSSAKKAEKKTSNRTSPYSEFIPMIGVIVVLLVIAAILSGISGGTPDNSGYSNEVDNYAAISGSQMEDENNQVASDQNEENSYNFLSDNLIDENRIDSEVRKDSNQVSDTNTNIPDGNIMWTYTTKHDLSNGYCVISNEIAIFAMNGDNKKFNPYLLAIDSLTGNFKYETNFGGCKVEPIVLNGVIYINEIPNYFSAYDAQTGKKIWTIENKLMGSDMNFFEIINNEMYLWTKQDQISIIDPISGQQKSTINFKTYEGKPLPSRELLGITKDTIIIKSLSDIYGFDLSSGEQKWKKEDISCTPIIFNEIIYYIMHESLNGVRNNYLCASEISTGQLKWKEKLDQSFLCKQLFISDNLLYVFQSSDLLVFNPSNGELKWNLNNYYGGLKIIDNTLIGLKDAVHGWEGMDKTNGQIKWKNNYDFNPNLYYRGENNGMAYFYNSYDVTYALNPSTGIVNWVYDPPTFTERLLSTVMDPKGVLYVSQNKDTGEYNVYGIA